MNTNDKRGQLVSIIIPSYNAASYVKDAVDSALAQTHKDIEIIVVDDGSTDNTREILRPYVQKNQIRCTYQENKGLAGARNTGIKNSRGGYIAFLDADDLFLPDKIAEQVAVLKAHPDFGICYCDLIHFTDTQPKKFYHHRYYYPSGDIFEPLLHRQFINPLAVMARREIFDKYGYFDEGLRRSEDWDLWLRWAHAGVKFYYLDKPLAHYRMRGVGNLSSIESEPAMKDKNLELFTRFGKTLGDVEWQKYKYSKILRNLQLKAAFAYLMIGDKNTAIQRISGLPAAWRLVVAVLPAGMWRALLALWRRAKHRLLLKKV